MKEMRTWVTKWVRIEETKFDHSLHCFRVYRIYDDQYLGPIIPDNISDMEILIDMLNVGGCPIEDKWEDGFGNTCTIDGW